jgi:hypothetical protein
VQSEARAVRALSRWTRQPEWISELAFIPLAIIFSWCLRVIDGVPWTDDGLGLVVTETYRRAYKAGDWFPTWTVFMEQGHGTALPLLYHRLLGQLTALLALKTGTLQAVKASIPALLVVGAIGMRRLCRYHGARPWVAWIAGALLMSANYTVTDWYIRGATAELCAFMLVPWGLRYASEIYERRWGALRLAVVSALVFFAHMMTCYFFFLPIAVVMSGGLLKLRALGAARIRAGLGQATAFGALLTMAIGPYAAAVSYVSAFSGTSGLGMRGDAGAYAPWWNFIIDPEVSWSRSVLERHGSWEIGRWILLCLAVCLLLAPAARRAVWRRAGALLLLAALFVVLQRQEMAFVFNMVPGASKIQFPSRLLVFVTVIAILAMAIAVETALRSSVPYVRLVARALPVVAAVCQGNVARGNQAGVWTHLQRDRAFVTEALSDPTDITRKKITLNNWPDFVPHHLGRGTPEEPFLEASQGCSISSPTLTGGGLVPVVARNVAFSSLSFTVHGNDCKVKLDQYQSIVLRVDLSKPGRVSQGGDGATLVEAPDGTVAHVSERSVMDLAKKFFIEKTRRFP